MARVIVTAVSATAMLYVAIQALSFRQDTVSDVGLSGANETALNMTRLVSTDGMTIVGNALPRLFIVVLLSLLAGALLITR